METMESLESKKGVKVLKRREKVPYLAEKKLRRREEQRKEWEKVHLQASIQQLRLALPLFSQDQAQKGFRLRKSKSKEMFFCPAIGGN